MRRIPRIWKAFGPITAITIILTIQSCAPLSLEIVSGAYRLVVSVPQQLKNGETAFANALQGLNHHPGVSYEFHLVRNDGTTRDFKHNAKIAIKTDRVITTELAKSLSQGGYTPIGSSITHHLYAPQATDIAIVLDQIQN